MAIPAHLNAREHLIFMIWSFCAKACRVVQSLPHVSKPFTSHYSQRCSDCRLAQVGICNGLVSEGRYWRFLPSNSSSTLSLLIRTPHLKVSWLHFFHAVPVICMRSHYSPVNWAEQRETVEIYEMLGFGWMPGKVSKKIPFQYIANKPVEQWCQILISLAIFCCCCCCHHRQNTAHAKFQGP